MCHKVFEKFTTEMSDEHIRSRASLWWWIWTGSLHACMTTAQSPSPPPPPLYLDVFCPTPTAKKHTWKTGQTRSVICIHGQITPAETLCEMMVGISDAAAKRDSGSVPSSKELSGSRATELEDDEVDDVLPFRTLRRDFESVTWRDVNSKKWQYCLSTNNFRCVRSQVIDWIWLE